MRGELRQHAHARCIELLRRERTYDLSGLLSGQPVMVNAAVHGNKFDVGQLRHAKPAPNGLLPWLDASGKMTWLTRGQVELLAAEVKAYEMHVCAVRASTLARIAADLITTTAQIDALKWPV